MNDMDHMIAFALGFIIMALIMAAIAKLGAAPRRGCRFAWYPLRISEERGPNYWYHTTERVWLEWVECHPMAWGDTLYTRVRKP